MLVNNNPKTYIYKSNTGEAYEYIDIIDYKGKDKKDLVPGDDISIGTENFRVFYNKDGVIKAMPFYNITLPSNLEEELPIQSFNAGNIQFSSSNYWTEKEGWSQNSINNGIDINMTEKEMDGTYKNNLQKYIEGYKQRLEDLGVNNIEVRAPKKWELEEEGITGSMRWPGGNGGYWLGSGNPLNKNVVWCIDRNTRSFQ